ncbi:multidrug resistance-associated ABC transporter [Mycena pura]|uniref:Multidrug resistance-associated ABC transporter n=1 Tax=Mycena pura TaxID=153505 RepID=A0AAD6ULX1_9AGAR|nr:multidrug resistance-associated ABC transporter [Mycena pura]
MTRYQLQLGVALDALAVCSAALFYANRAGEGKIQLPEDTHDPFEVTTPEDLLDGYPLHQDIFWPTMRARKTFLSTVTFLSVLLQAATLVLGDDKTAATLHQCFAVYVFAVAVSSIRRQTVSAHAESIWHLSSLTFSSVALTGFIALLPSEDPAVVATGFSVLPSLWYIWFALQVLVFFVAVNTPCGPSLHYPPSAIYSEKTAQAITNKDEDNVAGVCGASPFSLIFFSYSAKVVMLGNTAASLEIGDLPILPADMRATFHYAAMVRILRTATPSIGSWRPKPGSGATLAYQLVRANYRGLAALIALSFVAGALFYLPPFFLGRVLAHLERDPEREHIAWGLVWVASLFASNLLMFTGKYLLTGQIWSLSGAILQARIRTQLSAILFAKTLVRKDIASTPASAGAEKEDETGFASKAQIMTLMHVTATTDVGRVAQLCTYLFEIIDVPMEIIVGTAFVYQLLGISCFFGLGVAVLCLPLNHLAGKVVAGAQEKLMKTRDKRIALMNEARMFFLVLGGIRMLKFMAWERSFEARILKVRAQELAHQRLYFIVEALLSTFWHVRPYFETCLWLMVFVRTGIPLVITLVSFYHFVVVRGETLTPSIAFTSIIVFGELRYALFGLMEMFLSGIQSVVSLRRIEEYLNMPEVTPVPQLATQSLHIAFQSCTVTWPQDRTASSSAAPSAASTPRHGHRFLLLDLSLRFPRGELSLICGKLGSGKTLLLLALLGEAEVLAGSVMCPRSPVNALASLNSPTKEDWVVQGVCAYVPQTPWLQNASIRDNILFNLPYDEERYQLTLRVCALVSDLDILEDGDESEIGERGVTLSGGQKARVSLARAVYSRASTLILDDVLSAVDAHTAHHLYYSCLRGELMQGRTVILVSHHVQLCVPGAAYVVALDNGCVLFQGSSAEFQSSDTIAGLVHSTSIDAKEEAAAIDDRGASNHAVGNGETSMPVDSSVPSHKAAKKPPRKLIEDEQRAVGRVAWPVWRAYIVACGSNWYWTLFAVSCVLAVLAPVFTNGWLSYWSSGSGSHSAIFYVSLYAAVSGVGLILYLARLIVLYWGSIHGSAVLYKRLLEAVLFAQIRFHDTVSRGRLLNRFGKDFEGIDSNLPDSLVRTSMYSFSTIITMVVISFVGGPWCVVAALLVSFLYYQVAKVYGQACRDMRRLDSVTRSPLYTMYSETISGVAVLRAFGASSKFLRDMLRHVDTNGNPSFWTWGINRWISIRMMCFGAILAAVVALLAVLNKSISASLAGFALAFSNSILYDLMSVVKEFVTLEQGMVALERVKEYSDLVQEPPEFIEPRPDPSWPQQGAIRCENLVIRYAPELPNVLHNVTFDVGPGEKIGILGRTGSGKSTLALSFFRFVEPTEGRIVVDGQDISKIGITDLRSRLTIIPQDPTILSGTLRSTLDVFGEYQDAEIFEALRRVHLIPSDDVTAEAETEGTVNVNTFRNLDSAISEGGENISAGEKQLLCMARAILRRSRILVMDEATASVDYATDELIGNTIRHQFKDSTILTIAHRLRTVIDYDKVMLLDQGRIAEFDKPSVLLSDPSSKFHSLCKSTGGKEFAMLKKMAGVC